MTYEYSKRDICHRFTIGDNLHFPLNAVQMYVIYMVHGPNPRRIKSP